MTILYESDTWIIDETYTIKHQCKNGEYGKLYLCSIDHYGCWECQYLLSYKVHNELYTVLEIIKPRPGTLDQPCYINPKALYDYKGRLRHNVV